MKNPSDDLNRRLNDFATRSFRNMADRDYIAARMALRAELIPQFLWSSQQAIEKYLKHILVLNRIEAKVNHDIAAALRRAQALPFALDLWPETLEFIDHIATYGEYRYLDVSYHVLGFLLPDLDRAVWDLRRYCQVLDVVSITPTRTGLRMVKDALARLQQSKVGNPHDFRIAGGFLETVRDSRDHAAREPLIWQNAFFFGARRRTTVKAKSYFFAENSPLWLYPDMLDEVLKYVYVPRRLAEGYRQHLLAIQADPSKRPLPSWMRYP